MPLVALRFLVGHCSQVLSLHRTHSQKCLQKAFSQFHSWSYAIPAEQALPHPCGFSPRPTLVESVFSTVASSHNVQQLSLNEWRLLKIVLRNMSAFIVFPCICSVTAYPDIPMCFDYECSFSNHGTKICFYSVTDFFCSNAVVLRVYEQSHVLIWKCLGDSVSARWKMLFVIKDH